MCTPYQKTPLPYPLRPGPGAGSDYSMRAHCATIRPAFHFNARHSAESLRKAMIDAGVNCDAIVRVLTSCSNAQRQQIAVEFKTMYGKDLVEELKRKLSGNLENLAVALMTPAEEFDAKALHKAMAGIGTDEFALIEILVTRSNEELAKIKRVYSMLYHKNLEAQLRSETSGDFERILVALCAAHRNASNTVNQLCANQDAHALERAGVQRAGTQESEFIRVFVSQSFAQLRAVIEEYARVAAAHKCKTLDEAVRQEFSGDARDALLVILKCARDRSAFFAELIHDTMKKIGTDDAALIRLLVSRAELDLAEIRERYAQLYNSSLVDHIRRECSGPYRDALCAIVGGN